MSLGMYFLIGECGQKVGLDTQRQKELEKMYSEEQYHRALEVYEETQSVTRTIALLGYPACRQTLYNWINQKRKSPEDRSTFCGCNTSEHPRHPPAEIKLEALHRCFELGETVQKVANELSCGKYISGKVRLR